MAGITAFAAVFLPFFNAGRPKIASDSSIYWGLRVIRPALKDLKGHETVARRSRL
jgi:hypothetical protein